MSVILELFFVSSIRTIHFHSFFLDHFVVLDKCNLFCSLDSFLPFNSNKWHFFIHLWVFFDNNILDYLSIHYKKIGVNGRYHAVPSLSRKYNVKVSEVATLDHVFEGDALSGNEKADTTLCYKVDGLWMTVFLVNVFVLCCLEGSEQRDDRPDKVIVFVVKKLDFLDHPEIHLESDFALNRGW